MMEWLRHDIQDLLAGYQKRQFKPSEVIAGYLKAIEEINPGLNAFLEVRPEATLKRATELDGRMQDAAKLPLFGVPIALKDNLLLKDWQATAGSKILKGYRAPYSATCVEKLETAGAIIVGKANCDEFAMGSSNENSAFGAVKNPWDVSRVPGGSSGGSAAAVAASLCLGALGTDTGGSIRQPASLCGIVGMKPSYGRVSRYGVIAYSSSLDQVGPFARNIWDTSRLLEVMSGFDGKDSTSSRAVVAKYTDSLSAASLKNITIGVAKDWLEGLDPEVRTSFDEAISRMKAEGAKVVDVSLPHTRYALSTYYIIAPSEASSNLARYDGVHYGHRTQKADTLENLYNRSRGEGFGREVKLRIMLGTYALSAGYYDAYYLKANRVRKLVQQDFEKAFAQCHCVVAPTSPTTAFKLGDKQDDPLKMYLSDVYTLPVNLAGLPGISVPCGLDSNRLPIGLQFIGKYFDEGNLLQIAHCYEKVRGAFPLAKVGRGN